MKTSDSDIIFIFVGGRGAGRRLRKLTFQNMQLHFFFHQVFMVCLLTASSTCPCCIGVLWGDQWAKQSSSPKSRHIHGMEPSSKQTYMHGVAICSGEKWEKIWKSVTGATWNGHRPSLCLLPPRLRSWVSPPGIFRPHQVSGASLVTWVFSWNQVV